MARGPWDKLGLDRKTRLALQFDCDPGLEMRIQAAAVKRERFWLAVGGLLQPEFFGTAMGEMFIRLVHAYADEYHAPPDYTTARDLAGRAPFVPADKVGELQAHVDAVYQEPLRDVVYLERVVREMASQKAMRLAVVKTAQLNEAYKTGRYPTTEIKDVMLAALDVAAGRGRPVVDMNTEPHMLDRWVSVYRKRAVPTMLPSLDRMLRGGFVPGELVVLVAPPKRGKSLTLVNIAVGAWLAGNDVLYVSLEDGERGIGPRIYCRLTGYTMDDCLHDMPAVQTKLSWVLPMMHGSLGLVYMPPLVTGVEDVHALVVRENNKGRSVRLLILDYVDRMKRLNDRDKDHVALVHLYMAMHAMAEELGLVVLTASQATGEAYYKDIVDIGDSAGAKGKAAEVDVYMSFSQKDDEFQADRARIFVAGARNRRSRGIVHVRVDYDRSTLTECDPPPKKAKAPKAATIFPGAAPLKGKVIK